MSSDFGSAKLSRSKGRGLRHARATLAVLALVICAFSICAFSASAASAADPETSCCTVSEVSYTSAQLAGILSSTGGPGNFTAYTFEYSTDPETKGWSQGPGNFISGPIVNKEVKAEISLPEGGTKYFVRLHAAFFSFSGIHETNSPAPYPSFTTLTVDPPQITATDNASAVFSTSATATGKIKRPANPNSAFDVTCNFEYVSDIQFKATGFQGATVRPCAQNPIGSADGGTEKVVSAPLGCTSPVSEASQGNCLEPSTTYHLRLSARNAAPGVVTKEAASTFTTTAKVAKPTVISIDDVTAMPPPRGSYASVGGSGEVQRPAGSDPALDIDCRFEYVPDAQFKENIGNSLPGFTGAGSTSCEVNPIKDENPVAVKTTMELTAGTLYHLRLAAENGGGIDTKEASPFTTPPARLPVITINPAVAGYTTAEVSGTIDPKGCGLLGIVEYHFQYSTEPGNPESWVNSNVAADSGTFPCESPTPVPVGGTMKGSDTELERLHPNTKYSVRLLVNTYYDPAAASPEPNPSFTTKPIAPLKVTLDPITNIGANTAHFSGTVDANAPGPLDALGEAAYETSWHFECTPVCPELARTGGVGVVKATDGTVHISVDVTDLDANQPYEVKLVASNDGGTAEPERKFSTPLVKATVKSVEGASDGEGGYTLQGIVNPNNSLVTDCRFEWGPTAPDYAFSADCSPTPGGKAKPVTVEAHLPGLTPGAVYHALLVVTNGAGTADGGDQEFIPVLFPREKCSNEELRRENFSLGLPECRAYEQVSPQNKNSGEVYGALGGITADGNSVLFGSFTNFGDAGNPDPILTISQYNSRRGASGWAVAPLNGPLRSILAGPDGFSILPKGPVAVSSDLRSTFWAGSTKSDPAGGEDHQDLYLRHPDGTFTLFAKVPPNGRGQVSSAHMMVSDDVSHVFIDGTESNFGGRMFGPGVYEFTSELGPTHPRRVDVDNTGAPITTCENAPNQYPMTATANGMSRDGRSLFFVTGGGCGGDNPPVKGVYARVDATTTYDLTASQCTRTAGDPGGACFSPLDDPRFIYSTPDGSRVFFTTTQQLLNSDTDETKDIYACDLPKVPEAPIGKVNPCPHLTQIRGIDSGTDVDAVLKVSPDGSTVYFGSRSALADNENDLERAAVAGDRNIYVWRQDEAHPLGQTTFITRLADDDIFYASEGEWQTTPDGRYLAFRTLSALVPGDTDTSGDIYRYDAEAGTLKRVSIGTTGSSGNAEGFNAEFQYAQRAMSDDGEVIAFTTTEPLSPLDGNGNPDAYFWSHGRVFRASQGAKGAQYSGVSASGSDVFFTTREQLVPSDRDQGNDVYDARIGGGFPQAQAKACSGEGCLPQADSQPAAPNAPTASPPADPGNLKPKTCPKGKILKNGKCVKKQKRTHGKKSRKKHKGATGRGHGGAK